MKALYYDSAEGLEWRDDPAPEIQSPGDALVRPVAVSTCDLDQAIVRGTVPMGERPFAIGHEGAGEVVEVGDSVSSVRPGDLVAIPYHVSCGSCDRCADELPLYCRASAADALAVFGMPVGADYGGLFSDLVRVPYADHSLVKVPPNVTPAAAAFVGDNLTDAWRAIAPSLARRPGSDVLIMGAGSVGLFAVDIARACGARNVRYVDKDGGRCELAEALGARASGPDDFDLSEREFSISLVNSQSKTALRNALLATAPGGSCESVAFHFEDVPMPLLAMHIKGVHFGSTLANVRPHMPAVLELISSGRIEPQVIATEVLPFEDAADAMRDASFKPVFVRDRVHGSDTHP